MNKKEYDSLAEELALLSIWSQNTETCKTESRMFAEGYIQRDIEQYHEYEQGELLQLFDKALKYVKADEEVNETMSVLKEIFNFAYRAGFSCRNHLW